jgi:hypothetical protein
MALKALDRFKRESKRERENIALADDITNKTAEFILLSMALEFNEKDGYGKKRMEDRWMGALERCSGMVERYGDDAAFLAMREKAKERGFEIQITQGKKFNIRLKEDVYNGTKQETCFAKV